MSLTFKNLHEHFFVSYPHTATKFLALSGYIGIEPIQQLKDLPFNSEIIFGMFNENKKPQLHSQMINLNDKKTKIFYPDFLCHAKCYLWMEKDKPIRGLIGSANFSSNGLYNDYRETLFQVDKKDLYALKGYIELVRDKSIICTKYGIPLSAQVEPTYEICQLPLYDTRTGRTQNAAALNWGMNSKNHTTPNDAYIPILKRHIIQSPILFPPKLPKIYNQKRQNEVIEIIWDDGFVMQGLLEGTQTIDGIDYPKQISSTPQKSILGLYIRNRIGVSSERKVEREDLVKYGKDYIKISLLEEGVYYFDFSAA